MPSPISQSSLGRQLRRTLACARPLWPRLGLSLAIVTISSALSLIMPLGIRALLDIALKSRDASHLHALALGLLVLYLARTGLAVWGGYHLHRTGEEITIALRRQVFVHLNRLDYLFFTNRRVGDLSSRLSGDTASLRTVITDHLLATVVHGFTFLGAMAIMLALDWRLALIVLSVAPGASLLALFYGPRLRAAARRTQELVAHSATIVFESLSGIHMVKAFNRAAHQESRYDSALTMLGDSYVKSAQLNNLFRSVTSFLTTLSSVSIFWYGGLQVAAGRLSPGDLVAFLFYAQSIAGSIAQLARIYGDVNMAAASADRVFELLDEKPLVNASPNPTRLRRVEGSIMFESVSFEYPGRVETLSSISLSIAPCSTVALVGPSGGGKTTLIHLLMRLFDPTGGIVRLDGHDIRDLDEGWLRDQIAIVPQDTFLFNLSLKENIRFGRLDASDREVEEAAKRARAHEFIVGLPQGYDTEVGDRGVKLSGGQKQRVAIARAFLKHAPILLLDEATSHVDPASERLIQAAVDEMRQNRTAIIVAHRLSTVRRADQILFVQEGRITEAGTHEQLLAKRGSYWNLIEHAPPYRHRPADSAYATAH